MRCLLYVVGLATDPRVGNLPTLEFSRHSVAPVKNDLPYITSKELSEFKELLCTNLRERLKEWPPIRLRNNVSSDCAYRPVSQSRLSLLPSHAGDSFKFSTIVGDIVVVDFQN
jgi:hypothetical protein